MFVSPLKLDKKDIKKTISVAKNPKPIKSIHTFFILELVLSLSLNKFIANVIAHNIQIISMIVNEMLDITRLLKNPPG